MTVAVVLHLIPGHALARVSSAVALLNCVSADAFVACTNANLNISPQLVVRRKDGAFFVVGAGGFMEVEAMGGGADSGFIWFPKKRFCHHYDIVEAPGKRNLFAS